MFLRNVLIYIYMYIYVYLQKYADVHLLLMYMYVLRNVLTHMYVYCTRACTDLETHRGKIENTHVYVHAYLLRMHMHIYCTRVCTDMETDRGKIENIPVFPMCCDYCHKACMSMSHHLVPCHIIFYYVTSYQCFQCAATTATRHEKVKEKTKF